MEIGTGAFYATDLAGTLVIPATVTTIGPYAFANTKLTSLDLSKATSLVEIDTSAFANTKLTGLDLSKASSLLEIGTSAFDNIKLDNIKPVVG